MDAELRAAHDLPLSSFDVLFQLALTPGGRLRLSELADRVRITTLSSISRLATGWSARDSSGGIAIARTGAATIRR